MSSTDRNEAEIARLAREVANTKQVFAQTQQSNQQGGR